MRNDVQAHLPNGWAKTKIADLIGVGGVFIDGDWVESKDQNPNGKVRLIQLADIGDGTFINKSSRFLTFEKSIELRCTQLQSGDLLIARMPDPLGRACIFPGVNQQAVTVVDVCIVRCGIGSVVPKWLMYAVNAPEFRAEINALQSGSTRKRISRGNLSTLYLPIPPITEQQRIVEEIETQFSRLDAGVVALKRVQANLKRYRAAVLRAACEGRLVPTEAELARQQGRDYEPADVLLQRILAERRARWETEQLAKMEAQGRLPLDNAWKAKYQEPVAPDTSGLPELPDGWCWTSLGRIFQVYVGATPSRGRPEYWNGNIHWVSSGEVAFCRIRSTRETITDVGLKNSSTSVHPPGTVLLGMIGEGKTRGQVAILSVPACNNQNCAAIRVSQAGLPPEYIYYYLWSQYEKMRQVGSGNNQPALNKSKVEIIVFPLPPLTEQERIVAEMERRLSIVDELEAIVTANLKRAERLRQAILQRAFAGKLVPQDPKDEPASALLERIRAEREPGVENSRQQKTSVLRTRKSADAKTVKMEL